MANMCQNKSSAVLSQSPHRHNQINPQSPSTAPLCCPLCPATLSSRSHFLHHVGSTHRGSFLAACKTCAQSFAPHEITAHVASCKGAHVCVHCRQTFALLSYLKRHIRRRHSEEESAKRVIRYVCKFCSKALSSNNALNNHIRRHMDNRACNLCGASSVYERRNDIVICTSCGNQKFFSSIDKASSQGDDIQKCGHDNSQMKHQIQPSYTCPHCHRLYVSLTSFRRHLADHAAAVVQASSQPSTRLSPLQDSVRAAAKVLPLETSSPTASDSVVSQSTSECLMPSEFFDVFSEDDWLQADSYLCLSASPNISLLHSILYEGASAELS